MKDALVPGTAANKKPRPHAVMPGRGPPMMVPPGFKQTFFLRPSHIMVMADAASFHRAGPGSGISGLDPMLRALSGPIDPVQPDQRDTSPPASRNIIAAHRWSPAISGPEPSPRTVPYFPLSLARRGKRRFVFLLPERHPKMPRPKNFANRDGRGTNRGGFGRDRADWQPHSAFSRGNDPRPDQDGKRIIGFGRRLLRNGRGYQNSEGKAA